MGEVYGVWPPLQADETLSSGYSKATTSRENHGLLSTRSELVDEVDRLTGHVEALSAELRAERAKPDAGELLRQERADIDAQIAGLADHLTACMTAAMSSVARLERDVLERIGETETKFTDDVIDLRSTQEHLNQTIGATGGLSDDVREAMMRETTQLRAALSDVEGRLRKEVAEVGVATEGLAAEVIDLRASYEELDARQFDAVVQSGRLREELQYEATRLQDSIRESLQVAEKATFRSSNAVNSIDALQADFDQATQAAERRLDMVESLIAEIDARVVETRTQSAAQYQALKIGSDASARSAELDLAAVAARVDERVVARVDEVVAHVDEQVAARVDQQVGARLAAALDRIDELEAVSYEHGRRGLAATDVVAVRVRRLEALLGGLETLSPEQFEEIRLAEPPEGWQFERRSRLRDI